MNQAKRIKPIQWLLVSGGLLLLLLVFFPRSPRPPDLEISQLIQLAEAGQIAKIQVRGDKLEVMSIDGETFRSRKESSVSVLELLDQRGIATGTGGIQVDVKEEGRSFFSTLFSIMPLVIFGGLIFYMIRRSRSGLSQVMGIGKSQARLVTDKPSVTFQDVAGAEEAKQELVEIVEFLREPEKFARLGAKVPRGVLLTGAPGTGKTLIGRAVAGEAGVPFFSVSGSEFVEMFVGVGASRVRDLFARAKEAAPAIVFIDEIDAVGRHRGAGIGGGNDEREQTLNQILVEMDGFDERTNVIVIAATNRPDVLDPALLRPGRFDRRVVLDLPDIKGREAILAVHLRGKPILDDVDIPTLARQTHGFSGADLANLVNEAAILAARQEKSATSLEDLEEAIDRVIAGPARRSRQVSEKEREIVAYHEAGHALVAASLPNADTVHKVTIVPRGSAGGYTRLLPDEDRGLWSKGQFEAMMAVMMGGQVAEEFALGDITTGASNDLKNASEVARKMVTEYGMSEELGPRSFDTGQDMVFLGKELAQGHNYSDAIAEKIDAEIGSLLHKAQQTAKKALENNKARLTLLANRLLSDETIEGPELQQLLNGAVERAPMSP
ncbi:MAG: ATP-dependent zinc metalloprotease FtsH [Chloroflexi bacterium]|nr:ATP-dependent zinc metalloprotease FtsH [Chloroflexota bacterium]